jgi:Fe-S cluster biogenesis protein NfuA
MARSHNTDGMFIGLDSKTYTHNERKLIMKEKIQAAIEKIRPMLKADGGDVELVNVSEDGIVQVRLQGACSGCPMSQMTLKNGIERIIKQEVPEVKAVESVK